MTDPIGLFDLTGKIACVAGASSGLGLRAADTLLAAGAQVVGVARRESLLAQWQAASGDNAAFVVADVADRENLDDLRTAISSPFGAPDIIVHAAGVNLRQTADEVTAEGWDATIALNLSAPFFLSQALVPQMQARGWARIVNFASL